MRRKHRRRRAYITYVFWSVFIVFLLSLPTIAFLVYGNLDAQSETWVKALTITAGYWLLLILMATSLTALRIPWVDRKLGGLSEALLHHRTLGIACLFFLALHWCLAGIGGAFLPTPEHTYAKELTEADFSTDWIISVWDFFRGLGFWLGFIIFVLVLLALYGKFLRQTTWLRWHRILGVIVVLGSIHGIFAIPRAFQSSWIMMVSILLFFGCLTLLVIQFDLDWAGNTRGLVHKAEVIGNKTLRIVMRMLEGKEIRPGQFVCASFDKHEHPHPFSVVDSKTSGDGTELTVLVKDSGKYTHSLQDRNLDGQKAYIQGPYGEFLSEADPTKYQVWIAGGVGITPFLSAMQEKVTLPTTLIWSMRGPSEKYLQLVEERAKQAGITMYLIDSSKGQHLNRNVSLLSLIPDPRTIQCWFCGPAGMKESIIHMLKPYKVKVHTEHFNWR